MFGDTYDSAKKQDERQVGGYVRIDSEEMCEQSKKKNRSDVKLKKDLQLIYSKIHQNQQDFRDPTSPKHGDDENKNPTQIIMQKIMQKKIAAEENVATPKKDPPCFRKLAFSKAEIEKTFHNPIKQLTGLKDSSQQIVGDFVIGKQIGEGAYARVNDGILRSINKKIAIKIYDMKRLKGGNKEKAVEREIRLLKKMKHKNVVEFCNSIKTLTHVKKHC